MAEQNMAAGAASGGMSNPTSNPAVITGAWKVSSGGVAELTKEVNKLKGAFDSLKSAISGLSSSAAPLNSIAAKVQQMSGALGGSASGGGGGYSKVTTGSGGGNGMSVPNYSTSAGGKSGGGNSMGWAKTVALDAGVAVLGMGSLVNKYMDYGTKRDMNVHQLGYMVNTPYDNGRSTDPNTSMSRSSMEKWLGNQIGPGSGYSMEGGVQSAGMLGNFGAAPNSTFANQLIARGGAFNRLLGTNDNTGMLVQQQMYSAQTNRTMRQVFGGGTIAKGGARQDPGAVAMQIWNRISKEKPTTANVLAASADGGGLTQTLQGLFQDSPQMQQAIKQELLVKANTGVDIATAIKNSGAKGALGASSKSALKAAGLDDTLYNDLTNKSAATGNLIGTASDAVVPKLSEAIKLQTTAITDLTKFLTGHPNVNNAAGATAAVGATIGKAADTAIKGFLGLKALKLLKGGAAKSVVPEVVAGAESVLPEVATTAAEVGGTGLLAAAAIPVAATAAVAGTAFLGYEAWKHRNEKSPNVSDYRNNRLRRGPSGGPKNGTDGGGASNGQTFPTIESWANGVPNIVTSTTGGTHANGSLHYKGDAVDFAAPGGGRDTPGLLAINHYFAQKYGSQLSELIYAGPGGINIKNGVRVDGKGTYDESTMAGHHDHVHVGITPDRLGMKGGSIGNMNAVPGSPGSPDSAPAGSNSPSSNSPSAVSRVVAGALGSGNDIVSNITSSLSTLLGPAFTGGGGSSSGSDVGGTASGNSAPSGKSSPAPTTIPGGNVGSWIKTALGIMHKDMSFAPGLASIIQNESGGNPHSQNNTDSNAKAGIPSKGLMQTIDGTFAANAIAEHKDIWNPVDNIIAGFRYAENRYGDSMIKAGGRHNSSGEYIGYAQGSWEIERDQTARIHKGEMIIPADAAESVREAAKSGAKSGGNTYNNTFHITAHNSSPEEAEKLARQVMKYMSKQNRKDLVSRG